MTRTGIPEGVAMFSDTCTHRALRLLAAPQQMSLTLDRKGN